MPAVWGFASGQICPPEAPLCSQGSWRVFEEASPWGSPVHKTAILLSVLVGIGCAGCTQNNTAPQTAAATTPMTTGPAVTTYDGVYSGDPTRDPAAPASCLPPTYQTLTVRNGSATLAGDMRTGQVAADGKLAMVGMRNGGVARVDGAFRAGKFDGVSSYPASGCKYIWHLVKEH
ncbi:MAG TPA: hypothetical protein VFN42_07620 [Acetobacteraceae bacterium]|nr:hypothetical protein [Acetobacteraceae bacterium]